MVLSELSD